MAVLNLNPSFLERFCSQVLMYGPLPKHVVIAADGHPNLRTSQFPNSALEDRRRRKRDSLPVIWEAHKTSSWNYVKLLEVVSTFMDLGVPEVTIYSVCTDKRRRPLAGITRGIDLAMERMKRICDKMKDSPRRIRWSGKGYWENIPTSLNCLYTKSCRLSRKNRQTTLNFAFTCSIESARSRSVGDVINDLIREYVDLVKSQDPDFIQNPSIQPMDILFRTCSVPDASDLPVIWLPSESCLQIIDLTWEEFDHWKIMKSMFLWKHKLLFIDLSEEETNNLSWSQGQIVTAKKRVAFQLTFLNRLVKDAWCRITK